MNITPITSDHLYCFERELLILTLIFLILNTSRLLPNREILFIILFCMSILQVSSDIWKKAILFAYLKDVWKSKCTLYFQFNENKLLLVSLLLSENNICKPQKTLYRNCPSLFTTAWKLKTEAVKLNHILIHK